MSNSIQLHGPQSGCDVEGLWEGLAKHKPTLLQVSGTLSYSAGYLTHIKNCFAVQSEDEVLISARTQSSSEDKISGRRMFPEPTSSSVPYLSSLERS